MATSLGEAVLELKADRDGLERDLRSARMDVEGALGGLSAVGGALVNAGLAAATAGIAALGAGLGMSVSAAADAQQVQAQLNAVLQSTGGIAGVTAEQVNALADELSRLTPFEDEAIVSAESLLLTFTNIGQDVFPDATRIVLDMSQALGQDLKSSAIQLGKALQDPINGVTALRRVGVNFTDAQMEMIQAMVEAGDIMGAQKMILAELQTEFGGSAEAAGSTFAGQLKILKTQLGNIGEKIGGAVLPALSELAGKLMEYLGKPEVQAAITSIAEKIGEFAASVVEAVPVVIEWFKKAFDWLTQNKGVIVGVLAAIGVAIAAFVYSTVIPAAAAMIAATWPILAIMAAVAAVAYLVYTAWTENWGGIQEKVAAVWAVLEPIFQAVWTWLQDQIAQAIQRVGAIVAWLSALWTGTLQPALAAVWGFLKDYIFPLFVAIADFLSAVFSVALTALAGLWKNVLQPAIQAVWSWLAEKLQPVWDALVTLWQEVVLPIIEKIAAWLAEKLSPALAGLKEWLSGVTEWFSKMADAIRNLELPDWLTPGSPTPLEIGLRGIAAAMDDVARKGLPDLRMGLALERPAYLPAGQGQAAGTTINANISFADTDLTPESLQRALKMLEWTYA